MRKLNRKGFTLVELLAVIVILAIVVGIALTTVLPTLKKSRQEAFELTANSAAGYFENQYSLYLIGENTYDFTNKLNKDENTANTFSTGTPDDYQLSGLKADNYYTGKWYINETTGRACVWLVAKTNELAGKTNGKQNPAGEYYDAGTLSGRYNQVYSDGCAKNADSNYTAQ